MENMLIVNGFLKLFFLSLSVSNYSERSRGKLHSTSVEKEREKMSLRFLRRAAIKRNTSTGDRHFWIVFCRGSNAFTDIFLSSNYHHD